MGLYTIRELEKLSGIKAHTIRIWEKRYGLIKPGRTSTNIRTYCDSELKKLLNISVLNRNGIRISTIAKLSENEIVERINEIAENDGIGDSQIDRLTAAMVDLDEHTFEQVLAKSIIHYGFEDTVVRILYPFLKKVGLLWQTGVVNPAQEHFISNLIIQKFYVAIDGLSESGRMDAKHFIFFLPEGEFHEIGLLFMCFLAKKRGHHVLYLGQSVPLPALQDIIQSGKADCLVASVTTPLADYNSFNYFHELATKFRDKILFIGGSQMAHPSKKLPDNVRTVNAPEAFQKELDGIELTVSVN
jgi:DNA-binding transcriptional MerR regulator